jgi:hypothetical protein
VHQSSQLFSTVSRTRLVYSLRFSLYRFDASTLAGDDVLGSFSKLHHVSLVIRIVPELGWKAYLWMLVKTAATS